MKTLNKILILLFLLYFLESTTSIDYEIEPVILCKQYTTGPEVPIFITYNAWSNYSIEYGIDNILRFSSNTDEIIGEYPTEFIKNDLVDIKIPFSLNFISRLDYLYYINSTYNPQDLPLDMISGSSNIIPRDTISLNWKVGSNISKSIWNNIPACCTAQCSYLSVYPSPSCQIFDDQISIINMTYTEMDDYSMVELVYESKYVPWEIQGRIYDYFGSSTNYTHETYDSSESGQFFSSVHIESTYFGISDTPDFLLYNQTFYVSTEFTRFSSKIKFCVKSNCAWDCLIYFI